MAHEKKIGWWQSESNEIFYGEIWEYHSTEEAPETTFRFFSRYEYYRSTYKNL